MDESERRDQGMMVRRAILGDAHVDASIARSNAFTEEFQDLITRYAWGEIWTRQGLDARSRSLVTMSMLLALGRDDEFEMHVRASVAAGVTREEIKELLSLDRTRDRARIRDLAGARLEALAQQAKELDDSRRSLQRLLGACQGSNRGPCPIIEAFSPPPDR